MEKVRNHVIPYQWEALNDRIEGAAKSHCMQNFKIAGAITRIAAGKSCPEDEQLSKQPFGGCVFQDSDFAKWIEAVGYCLAACPDEALEKTADEAIDLVCAAQQPDGYLNTYYIINGLEKRFTNLKDHHELYCLGHMIEGAAAYYEATGKDKLLQAVIRYVDCVDSCIGLEEGKKHGYPGHEVLEMALVRLYSITRNKKHLDLAKYLIDQRGQTPLYFKEESEKSGNSCYWQNGVYGYQYYQAGKPVREQNTATGHAVRAVYLYSGMADVARQTGDEELHQVCQTLWNDIVSKQMYITGSIGQSEYGEAFSYDYDLPNDTVYGETCAAIGLVFFARRMLEVCPDGIYADVMEKALFNGIISGMSLDGQSFFYVNPLEVEPQASRSNQQKRHVLAERQKWFGCACCPPNLARLIASIGSYAYTVGKDTLFTHLYVGGRISAHLGDIRVDADVETNYPWEENVKITFHPEKAAQFTYAIRIPGFCENYALTVNGEAASCRIQNGYAYITRLWSEGDSMQLTISMPATIMESNLHVREDIGKVCVTRGPIVYCLEEADNGPDLHRIFLDRQTGFSAKYEADLLGGVVSLSCMGHFLTPVGDDSQLYRKASVPVYSRKPLKWIPYYAWANRDIGEMTVWVHAR